MGSKSKKEKIKSKIIFNIAVILLVFPLVLEVVVNADFFEVSPNAKLISIFTDPYLTKSDFVEFLNVGQADCTVIKSGNSAAIVDFGMEDDYGLVYKKLLKHGIKSIDLAIITHHHNDHMGGFLSVADKMQVDHLVINNSTAEDGEKQLYKRVIELAKEKGTEVHFPNVGDCYKVGNADFKILSCDASALQENGRSIVTMATICGKKLLFTGDGDAALENNLVKNLDIDCDILSLGHHGAQTSSTTGFLKAASPEIAIASCGYNNPYGHPSEFVISRAEKLGIKIYRTDIDRDVLCTFSAENNEYTVTIEREESQ